MAVVTAQLPPRTRELAADLTAISGKRRTKNMVMTVLMALAVIVVGFVLLLVLITVVAKGWSIVYGSSPGCSTRDIQLSPRRAGPGMKAAIIGPAVITLMATLVAVPLGLLGAV